MPIFEQDNDTTKFILDISKNVNVSNDVVTDKDLDIKIKSYISHPEKKKKLSN